MAQATFLQAPGTIDHTPASELAAGAVVVVGNIIGITKTIIPANEMGTINVEGQFRVVKKTGSVAKGDILYWDVAMPSPRPAPTTRRWTWNFATTRPNGRHARTRGRMARTRAESARLARGALSTSHVRDLPSGYAWAFDGRSYR